MKSKIGNTRRTLVGGGLTFVAAALFGCATQETKSNTVEVDVTGVDSIPKLIEAIKKAGKGRLPNSIPDSTFISEFARVFVENARAAAEQGFKIPEWVLDKLPAQKVVFPALGIMMFTAYGINFIIPVGTVIAATLGSIAIMGLAILAAISAMLNNNSKT